MSSTRSKITDLVASTFRGPVHFDVKVAMTQSARDLFKDEVASTLSQLNKDLRDAIDRAHHPWDAWRTHAATAAFSGAASWLVCYFLCR